MDKASNIEVGQTSGPMIMTISEAWNRAYREATQDASTPQTLGDDVIAPPLMIALIGRKSMSWIPVAPGAVHAKQSYRFHRPLRVDEELTVESTIRDMYTKRGKNYVVINVRVSDSSGALTGEGDTTRINSFVQENA